MFLADKFLASLDKEELIEGYLTGRLSEDICHAFSDNSDNNGGNGGGAGDKDEELSEKARIRKEERIQAYERRRVAATTEFKKEMGKLAKRLAWVRDKDGKEYINPELRKAFIIILQEVACEIVGVGKIGKKSRLAFALRHPEEIKPRTALPTDNKPQASDFVARRISDSDIKIRQVIYPLDNLGNLYIPHPEGNLVLDIPEPKSQRPYDYMAIHGARIGGSVGETLRRAYYSSKADISRRHTQKKFTSTRCLAPPANG